MMIESLGGVQSIAAQNVAKPQPVTTSQPVSMEGQDFDVRPMVDATTKAVEKADPEAKGNTQQDYAEQKQPSNEQIKQAVDAMRKKMNNSEVQFGIHEATNRVTIKIVDKETKKVIKELPAEETLDMIAKAWEMAGILVDERR